MGNLTALTTQAGMHSTDPLLYQGRMIAAIVFGFLVGAVAAGAVLLELARRAIPARARPGFCWPRRCCCSPQLALSTLSSGR